MAYGFPYQPFGAPPTPLVPGSKKPKAQERGYRVVAVMDGLDSSGKVFSTPDMALITAKRQAKAERRAYVIYRDGRLWRQVFGDGTEDVIEETRP